MNDAAFYETILICELYGAPTERQVCFVGALPRGGPSGEGVLTLRDGSRDGADAVNVDTCDVDVPPCAPLTLLRVHGLTRGGGGGSALPAVRATVLAAVEALDLAAWRSALLLRRAVLARQGLLPAAALGATAVIEPAAAPSLDAAPAPAAAALSGRRRGREPSAIWAAQHDSQEASQQLGSPEAPVLAPAPRRRRLLLPGGGAPRLRGASGDTLPADDT